MGIRVFSQHLYSRTALACLSLRVVSCRSEDHVSFLALRGRRSPSGGVPARVLLANPPGQLAAAVTLNLFRLVTAQASPTAKSNAAQVFPRKAAQVPASSTGHWRSLRVACLLGWAMSRDGIERILGCNYTCPLSSISRHQRGCSISARPCTAHRGLHADLFPPSHDASPGSMGTLAWVVLSFCLFYCVQKYLEFRAVVRSIHDHPGFRTLLPPYGIFGFLFKRPIPGITRGGMSQWRGKYRDFEAFGMDIISATSVIPTARNAFLVADPAAIKEITSSRTRFPKPVAQYRVLTFFGANIVTAEGDEWKRFRKITAPAFSERNNRLVWDETVKIMLDLFENEWAGKDTVVVDHAVEVTLPTSAISRPVLRRFHTCCCYKHHKDAKSGLFSLSRMSPPSKGLASSTKYAWTGITLGPAPFISHMNCIITHYLAPKNTLTH